ncbi:hypothetical protein Vretimale_8030 [Volvox reticuliferus]|uniref:Cytochrome b5 heme-binding domain-containing protein n=1 Tax=Volvox reticuliferus TaxID=1737510 RepID=A0A8J4FGG9_9CHLO|nr:hypothetical protein Vretifemale_5100 [Volvox reticuliferus]GIM03238.1 hypothetical protein Vretimale_8030 [Volvox reticuliferus]
MSACPFSSIKAAKDNGAPAATGSGNLRHASSSDLQVQAASYGFEIMSFPRTISTQDLHSEALVRTITSSPAPASSTAKAVRQAADLNVRRSYTSSINHPATATIVQRLTRRQLRKLGKSWGLSEVRQHARKDDAWIAVDGKVYDITEHLLNHPGWEDSSAISTVLSILAHAGTDCSQEFREIHRPYPVAWRQLQAYYIGDLAPEEGISSSKSS